MGKIAVWILIFLSFFLRPGLGPAETPSPQKSAAAVQPQEVLWIGILPEHNLFRQVERYEPLARYLSGETGKTVKLKVLSRYGNVIANFVAEGMDGAFFGSFTYALAHARLKVEALARPELLDGESSYHGMILVRKDSGIRAAPGMKGKVFAFVDKATTAGYLLPLVYFRENGIDPFPAFFRETYFAGTHEDVIRDVLERKADIGAAKSSVFQRMAEGDPRVRGELEVLGRSPDVPENALAVRPGLENGLKRKIQASLLAMHHHSRGREVLGKLGARKFIETGDDDYLPVYRYARKARLNLATYDYRND